MTNKQRWYIPCWATAPGHPPCVSQAAVVTSAWPWLGEGVAAVLADSSAPRSAAGAGAHHHAASLYYGDGDWSWRPGICCGCSYLLGPITGLMGRRIKHVFGLRSNTQYSGFLSCFCKVVLRNFWLAWSIYSLNTFKIYYNFGSSASSCLKFILNIGQ